MNSLHKAKKAKNDEFFTRREDIDNELQHYSFNGVVYCNCDDYRVSEFVNYFKDNFKRLGIKKLIATNFDNGRGSFKYEYDGIEKVTPLKQNGDFRSPECIDILQEADIVVTNPPFSLFREYIAQLIEFNKKFIILGNNNAITYKEIFPLIKDGKMWLGRTLFTGRMPFFKVSDDYPLENTRFEKRKDGLYKQVNSICWFTNVSNDNNRETLVAFRKYNQDTYPKYDNYDAIECSRMENLPIDYNGTIGIPITGLKYLHSDGKIHIEVNGGDNKFKIVDINPHFFSLIEEGKEKPKQLSLKSYGKKDPYARVLIKRIQNNADNT